MAQPISARPLIRCLTGLLAVCAALLAFGGGRAEAQLLPGEGGQKLGVQQRALLPRETVAQRHALKYHGGPIVTASDTYAIYWDPEGAYRSDWMALIDRYLHDVGADSGTLGNVFSLNSQYTGPGKTRASYNSTFRGAYTDVDPYPVSACKTATATASFANCLTDQQIHTELQAFIQANHLPTGIGDIYFLLTPPGVRVCTVPGNEGACSNSTTLAGESEVEETNGICGYHSAIEPTPGTHIVYGVQPWVAGDAGLVLKSFPLETEPPAPEVLACQNREALVEPNQTGERSPFGDYETGLADVIIGDLSVEQSDIVVDPLLDGWYQSETSYEQSDVCQGTYGSPGEELPKTPSSTQALNISNQTIDSNHYYLQWAFSSVGATSGKGVVCWQGTELVPHFTSPNPVNTEDIVGFDADESGMALDANLTKLEADEPYTAPVYKWEFGDGTPTLVGTQYASVFHSYSAPGTYPVTLTVTDSGGNAASFTSSVKVLAAGESPSAGPGSPPSAASTGTAGGTSTTPAPGSKGATPAAAPQVFAKVASTSLKKVLRLGLAVSYFVNEQVAGSLQVMLAAKTAKRLHVKGRAATGLPKGYPRQVVLGGAVLVTTAAGHGMLRVKLSRTVVKRLRHAHKLRLTLRIVVRNAERHNPKTATLLSVVVLKG